MLDLIARTHTKPKHISTYLRKCTSLLHKLFRQSISLEHDLLDQIKLAQTKIKNTLLHIDANVLVYYIQIVSTKHYSSIQFRTSEEFVQLTKVLRKILCPINVTKKDTQLRESTVTKNRQIKKKKKIQFVRNHEFYSSLLTRLHCMLQMSSSFPSKTGVPISE